MSRPRATEALVDLGDAAVFGMAEEADVGDDVQAELVLSQGVAALPLRAVGEQAAWATAAVAAADVQDEADDTAEGGNATAVAVVGPHRPSAVRTVGVRRVQVLGAAGLGPACLPSHGCPP